VNAQCAVLSKAGRDQVTISEIKTKLVGAGSYYKNISGYFEIQ
jgi:hypothetical protein